MGLAKGMRSSSMGAGCDDRFRFAEDGILAGTQAEPTAASAVRIWPRRCNAAPRALVPKTISGSPETDEDSEFRSMPRCFGGMAQVEEL
jgi:hypothetical protein